VKNEEEKSVQGFLIDVIFAAIKQFWPWSWFSISISIFSRAQQQKYGPENINQPTV
jgi:hypothetical protein